VANVRALTEISLDTLSLDEPVRTENDSMEHRESLKDQVKDEEASEMEVTVIRHLEYTRLWESIGELSPPEWHVVVRRYGLDDRESATLAELSYELSVTHARVRQFQHNAERHLRERLVSRLRMSMPQRHGVGRLLSVARCTT